MNSMNSYLLVIATLVSTLSIQAMQYPETINEMAIASRGFGAGYIQAGYIRLETPKQY